MIIASMMEEYVLFQGGISELVKWQLIAGSRKPRTICLDAIDDVALFPFQEIHLYWFYYYTAHIDV